MGPLKEQKPGARRTVRALLAAAVAATLSACAIVPLPHGGDGIAVSPIVPALIGGAIIGHYVFGHGSHYRGRGRGWRRGHGHHGRGHRRGRRGGHRRH